MKKDASFNSQVNVPMNYDQNGTNTGASQRKFNIVAEADYIKKINDSNYSIKSSNRIYALVNQRSLKVNPNEILNISSFIGLSLFPLFIYSAEIFIIEFWVRNCGMRL